MQVELAYYDNHDCREGSHLRRMRLRSSRKLNVMSCHIYTTGSKLSLNKMLQWVTEAGEGCTET